MSNYTPRNDGNHRVSNAILSTKLDELTREVRQQGEKMDRRFNFLEEKLEIRVGEVESRCHENTTQIARLDERQKAATGILGAISFVGSSIAATIGSLIK